MSARPKLAGDATPFPPRIGASMTVIDARAPADALPNRSPPTAPLTLLWTMPPNCRRSCRGIQQAASRSRRPFRREGGIGVRSRSGAAAATSP